MYSYKDNLYTLLGTQNISTIENEAHTDYENRMIYVCKDICQDFVNNEIFKKEKKNIKNIKNIKVILTNPWCIYEIMNLEKSFDKSEKITQDLVGKMMIHKDSKNMSILKNSISNIALNGYNVQNINNQLANKIHLQYISVYSSTNFLEKIKNTLETIFHLYSIEIDSVYSHINENHKDEKTENQLKIIIEDQGLDLSYIYHNQNIASFFTPCGGLIIKNKIKEILHIDNIILEKILKSKSVNLNKNNPNFIYEKTLDNIWPDLDNSVKIKIEETIKNELEIVKKNIRAFIDSIENQFIVKDVNINIYSLDEVGLNTMGLILGNSIKDDIYILGKLLTSESNVFTKKIF
jgi:hypothetical protein